MSKIHSVAPFYGVVTVRLCNLGLFYAGRKTIVYKTERTKLKFHFCFQLVPPNSNNPEVHPVGTEKSKHIDMLVTNQQISSSKRRGSSRRDGRCVRPPRRRLASANPLPVNRQTNQMSDRQTHHLFDGQIHKSVDRHQVNRPTHHQDNRQTLHPINRQTHYPIDRQTHHLIDREQHHPVYRQTHHPVGMPTDHEISTKSDIDFLQNIVWELIKKVAKSKSVSY